MTLKIEYKNITDLQEYENNSRTHTDNQVEQIIKSIKEFGFTNPILIDENNFIIAGHGRLMASAKMKLEQVPTILLSNLTDAQKKAYVIADNKLALNAGWDEETLKLELGSLDDDLANLTGFSPDEIDLLMNGWETDLEHVENLEAKDSVDKKKITIKCEPHDYDEVWEKVTNTLDSLGIDSIECA